MGIGNGWDQIIQFHQNPLRLMGQQRCKNGKQNKSVASELAPSTYVNEMSEEGRD